MDFLGLTSPNDVFGHPYRFPIFDYFFPVFGIRICFDKTRYLYPGISLEV